MKLLVVLLALVALAVAIHAPTANPKPLAPAWAELGLTYDPADIIDWSTEDGKAILGLVNQLALPHLQDVIKGAGLDPVKQPMVADDKVDIGIGEAEVGLRDLVATGVNSVGPFNNITATGQYTLTTGTSFAQLVATLNAFAKVTGATKHVCVPIIGCHDVPLPPLFGKTISVSATVTATMDQVAFSAAALLQVDANKLVITDPNSIREATVAAKVSSTSVTIGHVAIDVHGFDDPIIGKTVTDLVVKLLQDRIRGVISSEVEGPITDAMNSAIAQWLGHPGM
eukprot:CAMPEP_0177645878 /NCGR_PEP_ID=MMETSP0447-20121125/9480_1 /TAXON_ID=0 /ORGANISM="Stygamoeba regulata, Strain BSH-02190019" /LENGTH=282 /DNA_ID=CAMNT_0019148383 /DNA_START=203 /DNA_END=1051 /DNA_ORIENTATION=+